MSFYTKTASPAVIEQAKILLPIYKEAGTSHVYLCWFMEERARNREPLGARSRLADLHQAVRQAAKGRPGNESPDDEPSLTDDLDPAIYGDLQHIYAKHNAKEVSVHAPGREAWREINRTNERNIRIRWLNRIINEGLIDYNGG